jgi:hypothetical protein
MEISMENAKNVTITSQVESIIIESVDKLTLKCGKQPETQKTIEISEKSSSEQEIRYLSFLPHQFTNDWCFIDELANADTIGYIRHLMSDEISEACEFINIASNRAILKFTSPEFATKARKFFKNDSRTSLNIVQYGDLTEVQNVKYPFGYIVQGFFIDIIFGAKKVTFERKEEMRTFWKSFGDSYKFIDCYWVDCPDNIFRMEFVNISMANTCGTILRYNTEKFWKLFVV